MKLLKNLFPVLVIMLMWASCTEDDGPGIGAVLPTSDISTTSAIIPANGSFTIDLTANDGDSPLNTLTIQKGVLNVSASTVTIDGSTAPANPVLLFGADKTSFTYSITVMTDLAPGETADYSFIVDAENNDNTTEVVTVTAEDIPPSLNVSGGSIDLSCPAGSLKALEFVGIQGGSALSTITVYEDGVLVDTSRLEFGSEDFDTNPYFLGLDDSDGFTQNITFRTHTMADTRRYRFELTDENGLQDTISFLVTSEVGTPIETILSDSLFNFAGPNAGSMVIPGFNAVFQGEPYDIRDQGNNGSDWRSTFALNSTVAGLELRRSTKAAYDGMATYEDIEAAWAAATVTAGTTDEIFQNDVYIISKAGQLYAMLASTVINTTGDNKDYIVFNVKQQM